MKKLLLISLLLSSMAQAKETAKVVYMTEAGKVLTPVQALVGSTKGDPIFKCQLVSAQVSKSGTSISLKAIKKGG